NFRLNTVPLVWPIFDLMAARYMVVDERGIRFNIPLKEGLEPRLERDHVRVLENPTALPRAFWVPRLEVMDPPHVLARLASSDHDPRRVALVEHPPADGFLGGGTEGNGEVLSMTDASERVDLAVRAS